MATAICNLLLPGSGLLLRDHLLSGCGLLLLSLAAVTVVLGAGLLAAPGFAHSLRLLAIMFYVLAAATAALLWWMWERDTPVSGTMARQAHAQVCKAWLCGDQAGAQQAALRLCQQARHHAPAWDLLALVATGPQRQLAQRQAQRLRNR